MVTYFLYFVCDKKRCNFLIMAKVNYVYPFLEFVIITFSIIPSSPIIKAFEQQSEEKLRKDVNDDLIN